MNQKRARVSERVCQCKKGRTSKDERVSENERGWASEQERARVSEGERARVSERGWASEDEWLSECVRVGLLSLLTRIFLYLRYQWCRRFHVDCVNLQKTRALALDSLLRKTFLFSHKSVPLSKKICRNTIKLIKFRDAFLIFFSFPPSLLKIRRCNAKMAKMKIMQTDILPRL